MAPASPALSPSPRPLTAAGWVASLRLGFESDGSQTRLTSRAHRGPLVVQRPFYPARTGECHVYVLHPPGGVVGGDCLALHAEAEQSAAVLLTTPAATKLYRSKGPLARIDQHFEVRSKSLLEWMPQETIAFRGSHTALSTRVELDATSRFSGWEVVCLGRPAAREQFESGSLRHHFELYRDGQPVVIERLFVDGDAPVRLAPWGLRGHAVVGTFIVAPGDTALASELAQQLREASGCLSITAPRGAIVCRYLGNDVRQAHELFVRAWSFLRPAVHGIPPAVPRIWAT